MSITRGFKMKSVFLAISLFLSTTVYSAVENSFKVSTRPEDELAQKNKKKDEKVDQVSKYKPKAKKIEIAVEQIETPEDLKNKLDNYLIILNKEKKEDKKRMIKLNSLVVRLQLARSLRIKSGGKQLLVEEKKILEDSIQVADELLADTSLETPKKAYVLYLKGMAYLDLNEKEKSRSMLLKSIELDPNSKFSIGTSIYLADVLFDEQKLEKSLKEFNRFYSKMNEAEKELVDYKIAWIYLNQSKLDQAQSMFEKIYIQTKSANMLNDAVQSLAIVVGENKDQMRALNSLEKIFSRIDPKDTSDRKLKLLWAVFNTFQSNINRQHDKITEKLLASILKTEDKIKIWLAELKDARYVDNHKMQIYYYNEIIKNIEIKEGRFPENLVTYQEEVEYESEFIISYYLQSYTKKRTPESLTVLKQALMNHLQFKDSKKINDVQLLLLDLLSEGTDKNELLSSCDEMLKSTLEPRIQEKVLLYKLDALESLYRTDQQKYSDLYKQTFEQFLPQTSFPNWDTVANKYVGFLVNLKDFGAALEVLKTIYEKNNSEAILEKLATVFFELDQCSEIIESKNYPFSSSKSTKISDFKRECNLKMASKAKESPEQFGNYENHIKSFIKSSDGDKKISGMLDYLATLEKKNQLEKIYQSLTTDFNADRFNPKVVPFTFKISVLLENIAQWDRVFKLTDQCFDLKTCAELNRAKANAVFVQSAKFDAKKLSDLAPDQLKYYEGFLSVLEPSQFIEYKSKTSNISALDKGLLELSLKLDQRDLKTKENKALLKKFGLTDDSVSLSFTETDTYKILKSINWNKPGRKSEADIAKSVEKVQKTRKTFANDLKKLKYDQIDLLLNELIIAERNCSQMILSSDIPAGLNEAQKNEYLSSLKGIAAEFDKNVIDYEKAKVSVNEKMKSLKNQNEAANFKRPKTIQAWFGQKVKAKYFSLVANQVSLKQYKSAVLLADLYRSQKLITDADYFLMRSGVFLISNSSNAMRDFVYQELKSEKQEGVIQVWKKL